MLNFDTDHQFIEGNIDKKNGKKLIKNIIIGGLVIASLFTFSGCENDIPCDIKDEHAHYYVNDEKFGRYVVSEKRTMSGLNRSDNYILVNHEDIELLDFINKENLFEIEENKKVIDNISENHHDYIEYRYKYLKRFSIPIYHSVGKHRYVTFHHYYKTMYSWTTDTTKDLTGEQRVCHYVYYGYKVMKNKEGTYEALKSEPVDNLYELPDGYNYIEEDFYNIVDPNDKYKILDYEDGQEENEFISDESYNQEQEKTYTKKLSLHN